MSKPAEQITLDNINIQIIRSKRRRTSQIEIKNKQVLVRAPYYLPQFFIRKFIKQKRNWIVQHLTKQELQPDITPKQFKESEIFLLFNQPFTLRIKISKTGAVNFQNEQLCINIPARVKEQHRYARDKVITWYKQTALAHIQQRTERFAKNMGVKAKSVRVREYKRRWGSCTSKGDLSFNWRIIMAPETAIDYVVIHELAHLKEFNHSKKFWQLVQQAMPDYKLQIQWFKNHASQLRF